MSIPTDDDVEFIGLKFTELAHSNYEAFSSWLEGYCGRVGLDYSNLIENYSQPGARTIPLETFEDDQEGTLWYPPDPGPLASHDDHGWLDNHDMDDYRNDSLYKMVRANLGIDHPEVLDDIRENTLHILGRCNEPENWGEEDRRGLVYGMIQSGKTASMINLIASGMKAGYKLFIVLAGDKSSLRNQSQERVNSSFNLTNGINQQYLIHSPTFKSDYDGEEDYMSAFRCQDRLRRGWEYQHIIVIKKNVHLLRRLIKDLEGLGEFCKQHSGTPHNFDFSEDYRCMIIDDEADYASQDTDTDGDGSAVHQKLVELRSITDFRNCYIAYTATPQACLSANPNDPIGYPKDFFWVLEPYMERDGDEGPYRTTSYLGASEVFNEYDAYLLRTIGRDEWPHHERDDSGKYLGVWVPGRDHQNGLEEIEKVFLDGILSSPPTIDIPKSLISALHSHIITNGVRWYDYWKKKRMVEIPGALEVQRDFPEHATMIHLSRIIDHQMKCRKVAMLCWEKVIQEWEDISSENDLSPKSEITKLWADQRLRSRNLPKTIKNLSFNDVLPFMKLAIEITNKPIQRNDSLNNYPYYTDDEGQEVCFYLINSDENLGMKLHYSESSPIQVRTKKSAVMIGGDILSRGLTIEGLSVSYFGRSAGKETHDTVLQRGRWFGHKKNQIDLVQVFLQRQAQLVFRQISIADYELRIQMKQAIRNGLKPMQILLQLRNSPYFASTSSAKSKFVNSDSKVSFSGTRAVFKEPIWKKDVILSNNRRLTVFENEHSDKITPIPAEDGDGLAHGRAKLYTDVPIRAVIRFLTDLGRGVDDGARNVSPQRYAKFLKEWLDNEMGTFDSPPKINVAVWNKVMRRKRFLKISKPKSIEEARENATGLLEAIVGGKGSGGKYKGDYFIDRSKQWHESIEGTPDQTRRAGDSILIVIYKLDPNYLTRSLFNPDLPGWEVQSPVVKLTDGELFVDYPDGEEEKYAALTFAAFTPNNGPMYQVGTNRLVASAGEVLHNTDQDVEDNDEF